MADVASIAIRKSAAKRRLQDAMLRIGKATGVPPVILPAHDPDPAYLEAWQLDVLAGYAEQVADFLVPPAPEVSATLPDYDAMTRAEAVKRAEDAGMPRNRNTTKAEAVDWLMAAAGITEDQQAALDTGAEG